MQISIEYPLFSISYLIIYETELDSIDQSSIVKSWYSDIDNYQRWAKPNNVVQCRTNVEQCRTMSYNVVHMSYNVV